MYTYYKRKVKGGIYIAPHTFVLMNDLQGNSDVGFNSETFPWGISHGSTAGQLNSRTFRSAWPTLQGVIPMDNRNSDKVNVFTIGEREASVTHHLSDAEGDGEK